MEDVEIPEPQHVRLSSSKTAVIVVDMQNDFAHPRGKLYVPQARETIPAIARLLDKARKGGSKIFYTQDWHSPQDPEFAIWGEHAVEGSWGAEIVDELKPSPDDRVLRKLRYDGFYGTSLDHLLRIEDVENLVICGTVANICVLHTAGSAALRWWKIYIPVDTISALTEFDYRAALRQITFLYRGVLTEVDRLELS
ncbi:MAG: isochorismatase family cysteine hydrolase [Nitrososphaerota archaeon]